MNYIDIVRKLALNNKYTTWYCNIIINAQQRDIEGYVEKHHILPKSFNMGGEKDCDNIVKLTAREHYVVHLCAIKMFTAQQKQKMWYAFRRMNTANAYQNRYINSKLYQSLKISAPIGRYVRLYKGEQLKCVWKNDATVELLLATGWSYTMPQEYKQGRVGNMIGKRHTECTKQKISQGNIGKKGTACSVEKKEMLSKLFTGRVVSDATKMRISEKVKQARLEGRKSSAGINNPMFGRKRKAIYHPSTKECKYIDITHTTEVLDAYLQQGWKYGLIRNKKGA